MSLRHLIARQFRPLVLPLAVLAAGTSVSSAAPQITPELRAMSARHAERLLAERGLAYASPEVLEGVKTELLMVLTEFNDIEQVMGVRDRDGTLLQAPGDPGPSQSRIPGLMNMVGELTDAELTLLSSVLPDLRELHRVTRELRTDLQLHARTHRDANPTLGGSASSGSRGTFPTASYGCAGGRPSYGGTVAGLATVQTARGVALAASRGCDLTALGFNAALVCLITDGVHLTAEAVWSGIELCTSDADSAEILASYERNAYLASRQDQMISTLGTINANILAAPPALILNSLIATQTSVTASRDTILTALEDVRVGLISWIQLGASTTITRVDEAETNILNALQTTGLGAIETRLTNIEQVLDEEIAAKRIVMSAVNVTNNGEETFLIVTSQPGIGNVDVTFDVVEGYRPGHGFETAQHSSITQLETGVYEFIALWKGPSPYLAYRFHCRREVGPVGPAGDYLGSVYFNKLSLNSGGQ